MKTAEDYIRQINDRIMPHPHRLSRKQREVVKYLIGEIQKEAYNHAIEDVLENVVIKSVPSLDVSIGIVPKVHILKLKK